MKFLSAEVLRIYAKSQESGLSTDSAGKIGQCGLKCRVIIPLKKYSVPVAISVVPNLGGAVCSMYLRKEYRHWYENLRKPSWCPRHWLFFPMFNVCYACMGLSSYMVYANNGFEGPAKTALQIYGTQMVLAWLWVPLLFKRRMLGTALLESVILVGFSGATVWAFAPIKAGAAAIFFPTFLWSVYLMLTSLFLWRRNAIVLKNG
ncbi:translocator protein-like [Amblyomma americanum]